MSSRPTLKLLAGELGLTVAAVSMALRNHPRISEETRKRAQALARKRGYVPNPAFGRQGALAKKRGWEGMPLALILQDNPTAGTGGISDYTARVEEVARNFGYKLQVHSLKELPLPRLSRILYARGVEAVMLGPVFDKNFARTFPWNRYSVVALEAGHYRPPCHLVMPDIAGAMIGAVRKAIERGYRRIGLYEIAEPVQPVDHYDRAGAVAVCAAMAESYGRRFFHLMAPAYQAAPFLAWFRDTRPDVVIAQTEAAFWWVRDAVARRKRPVGHIVLRIDSAEVGNRISGYIQDHIMTATVAMKLLDAEVRNFERGKPAVPTRQLVDMPWIEGNTLPPKI